MNLLRCASLVVRGSLKQYTDTPPVLDRFKKWFLYGISGEASCILRLFWKRGRIGLVKNGSLRELRKRHGTGNEVDRNFNSRFGGFEKLIWG